MTVPKKRGRPKGSKNRPKPAQRNGSLSLTLREATLQGILDIHMETGVGIAKLLEAAVIYATERPYQRNKRLREIITDLVHREDSAEVDDDVFPGRLPDVDVDG